MTQGAQVRHGGRGGGPDLDGAAGRIVEIAERTRELVRSAAARHPGEAQAGLVDTASVGRAFAELARALMTNPAHVAAAQLDLWRSYVGLWQSMSKRALGQEAPPFVQPGPGDRRFKDEAWSKELPYDFLKQSYLINARWLQALISEVPDVDERTRAKVRFFVQQYVDAVAPTNFAFTNPVVVRKTIETNGQNLLAGLSNLLDDLANNKGLVKNRAPAAFEVGKNLAVTPGSVVYQNDLIQLIQYDPSTEKVARRPVLFVPPWVNKYYLFDLQPKNSFIRWLVGEGHTVFAISWVNPGEAHRDKDFFDYMREGPAAALDAIERATGEREANLLGYCLGGTLTATMLAYHAAKGDERVASATLIATFTDFADIGEFAALIDEDNVRKIEQYLDQKGYLEGHDLARLFSALRANDLIWSGVVSNYLLAEEVLPFDMNHWFADAARMPCKMLTYYMRKVVLENGLAEPGRIQVDGVPLDLGRVRVPVCSVALRDDHVAPWRAVYAGTRRFGGPARFILGGSGHNAGTINPPAANKHGHWTNPELPETADAWLAGATRHEGSWWPEWARWLGRFGGGEVAARRVGAGKLKPLEPAPGSYVKVRA